MTGSSSLICPGCRAQRDDRLELRTLDRAGDFLVCACGRRYPIVDGVPIVLGDPSGYLQGELASVIERDLPPELAAALAEPGPDDAPYPRLLEHLSTYLDAHWGDRATPPPDGPGAGFGARALIERIAARAAAPVGLAVELGCSVGRGVAALAAGAEHVVGIEHRHAALRRARALLGGATLAYPRRAIGRHYTPAVIDPGAAAAPAERIALACADALDPPLVPEVFERVVALNLIDSVDNPHQLLAVLDGLCAPGGELLLASPYAWQSDVVAEAHRFGGADPAGALIALLEAGTDLRARYRVEDTAELPWVLRRDARSAVSYRIHYVRARKS